MNNFKTLCWSQLESWLLLTYLNGIGSHRFQSLLKQFNTPKEILEASYHDLKKCLPDKLAKIIATQQFSPQSKKQLQQTKNWLEKSNIHHIIHFHSPYYPKQLKEIPDPPPILYLIGNPQLLSAPQVAIVGSRNPTNQGLHIASMMAKELSQCGITITSGLALGIDAAAHIGAIKETGSTIAVLGTGIDIVYPKQNKFLYPQIQSSGAIISEFPLQEKARPSSFPKRNRIISGLSLGLIVIEAKIKSGSLVSARLANEQGREVFAVPGSILNSLSSGCHALIKEGAILIESYQDVLYELKEKLTPLIKKTTIPTSNLSKDLQLNSQSKQVLQHINYETVTVDQLCYLTNLSFEDISLILTELEIEGYIKSVFGGFQRTNI